MRVVIRGFADGELKFADRVTMDEAALATLLPMLAKKHAEALADASLHMIEIDFPDEPEADRFFRFGTDAGGMVMPIRLKIEPSIACPKCGRVSYNPNDIANQYCGACHAFHEDLI